jgi:hypothetical protein
MWHDRKESHHAYHRTVLDRPDVRIVHPAGLSTVDRLIVEGYINNHLDTIETLGWTEGLVAVLPFLPAAVDVSLLKVKEQWSAALRELPGEGDKYTALNMREADVKPLAIDRIRRYLCGFATNAQRDSSSCGSKRSWLPRSLLRHPMRRRSSG